MVLVTKRESHYRLLNYVYAGKIDLMYSKQALKKTVDRKLKELGYSYYRLAKELGMQQNNLNRAFDSDTHNLTLQQFSVLVVFLQFSEHDVYAVLNPKKKPTTISTTMVKKISKKNRFVK